MKSCFGQNCNDESRDERKFNQSVKKSLNRGSRAVNMANKAITRQTKALGKEQRNLDKMMTTYNDLFETDDDVDLSAELREIEKTMKGGGTTVPSIAFLALTVVAMSILGGLKGF